MPLTAAANIYTETYRNGQIRTFFLEEDERLLTVRSTTLCSFYWEFWNHIRSCLAHSNPNEDTILILFENPYNGYYPVPDLDYTGDFLQIRQHKDDECEGSNIVDNIPRDFPELGGVASIMLIGGQRQDFWEFGFSVRDALEERFRQEFQDLLQEMNSDTVLLIAPPGPCVTWKVHPCNIEGLDESLVYISLYQTFFLDVVTGAEPFYHISDNVELQIYIHLWIDNGQLRGEFARMDVSVTGSLEEQIETLVSQLFACRILQLEEILQEQLNMVNDSLADVGSTINDMYFLPGNQIDYGQIQIGGTDVWIRHDRRITGNTYGDVTIVLEVPV